MKKIEIFPSLMAADLLNLEAVIKRLEPYCDGFHIDIMDNHFVPNLTWGPMMVNEMAHITKKPLQVHLMIEQPETMIDQLALTPKSIISFHIEATDKEQETIAAIQQAGYMPSAAIKPGTPLNKLFPLLETGLPHVLLMSVEPGFSGQKFLPASLDRLKKLVSYKTDTKKSFIICMDGGINQENIGTCRTLGAQQFAIASGIFGHKNAVEALKDLYIIKEPVIE